MNNKRRGSNFERDCMRYLVAWNYEVIRAADSRGPCDLWAAREGSELLNIQCKLGGYMTPLERWDLWLAAWNAGGLPVMVSRPGRGKKLFQILRDPDNGIWDEMEIY